MRGHEADDIIAYLAHYSKDRDLDVRIVTGDRDFFQTRQTTGSTFCTTGVGSPTSSRWTLRRSRSVTASLPSSTSTSRRWRVTTSTTSPACRASERRRRRSSFRSTEAPRKRSRTPTSRRPSCAQNLAAHGEQVAINKKLSTLQEVPLEGVDLDDMRMGGWDMRGADASCSTRSSSAAFSNDCWPTSPRLQRARASRSSLTCASSRRNPSSKALVKELDEAGEFAVDLVPSAPRGAPRSLAFSWAEGATAYVGIGAEGSRTRPWSSACSAGFLSDPKLGKLAHGALGELSSRSRPPVIRPRGPEARHAHRRLPARPGSEHLLA